MNQQAPTNLANKTVPIIEKANFCRYLSTMIRSGTPILEGIDTLANQTTNKNLNAILREVKGELEKGRTLGSALEKYPKAFDKIFLTVLEAGEKSGTLDKSLDYLGKQTLADYYLLQKVRGALMYPTVIITAMVAMGFLMIGFVLPRIAKVFLASGFPLPAVTKFIFSVSLFVSEYIFIIIPLMFASLGAIVFFFMKGPGRQMITKALPHLPVIKKIFSDLDIARFSRILGTLLQSGVPIIQAIEISTSALTMPEYIALGNTMSAEITKGATMQDVLKRRSTVFPKMVTGMIAIGEKTGALEKILFDIADFYDLEVDNSLKNFTTILEPLLMIVVGIAVALMVLAIITPIYSLVGNFQVAN